MSGSRHDHFSDATRLSALRIVKANNGISAVEFSKAAEAKGLYSPQASCPARVNYRAYGHRLLKDLHKDGLVKRSTFSVKWGQIRYFLTNKGIGMINSGDEQDDESET